MYNITEFDIPEKLIENTLSLSGYDRYPDIIESVQDSDLSQSVLLAKLTAVVGYKKNGDEIRLSSHAALAWESMKIKSAECGITLVPVSGYRSVKYQKEVISRARKNGREWEDILKFISLPGFSQHHTGKALDVTSELLASGIHGNDPLVAEFAESEEYKWLLDNCYQFGFSIPYNSKNRELNPGKFGFEPWHIFYKELR